MAGGKETPRQKMIGMMYIVLTALLALQVSSAVMEKFILLDQSLKDTAVKQEKLNDGIVERIKTQVKERGNKAKEVALLKAADNAMEETHKLREWIEKDLREGFVVKAGGWEEGKEGIKPQGAKNTEITNEFFIGPEGSKKGQAYVLEKRLDEYAALLKKVAADNGAKDIQVPDLAVSGKEHSIFKDDPDQRIKDFAKLNFEDSPVVAALATLSEIEAKIMKAEENVLNALAGQVGAADFKFDLPSAMYRANSSTVAAGTTYEGEMFVAASSSSLNPEMRWKMGAPAMNEKGIPKKVTKEEWEKANKIEVDPVTGRGALKFKAAGGGYDKEGKAKRSWSGYVKMPKPTGGDTIFVVKGEYIVAKPVIQVQSGAVSALYKDCGNLLDIQVPALGSLYNPSFSVSGGNKVRGRKKGQLIVIPNRPKVAITVSSGGTRIGTTNFKVRLVPKPDIVAKLPSGKAANLKKGERAGSIRSLRMSADCSDNTFKQNLPKDARYSVAQWEVMLVRGKRPVNKRMVNGSSFNVSSLGQQRPGDRILIDVKRAVRKNYQNRTLPVTIPTTIINIPLTD